MFEKQYTNPQLTEFTAALFVVTNVHFNDNSSANVNLNEEDNTYSLATSGGKYFNYSLKYWASQEAKDTGAKAYNFYETEPGELSFNLDNEELKSFWESLTGTEEEKLVAICEYHAENILLV